jgi:ABC-type bacteriocin/lantibiotic exporter with double-glycine peptidase domain
MNNPDLEKMRKELITTPDGLSATSLITYAQKFGVNIYPVQVSLFSLMKWNIPAILHVDDDHFIVFLGMENQRVLVFDNGIGYYDATPEWFEKHYQWSHTALLLKKPPAIIYVLFDSVFLSVMLGILVGIIFLRGIFYKHR